MKAPTHPAADPADPGAWEVVSSTGGVLHVIHGSNAARRARSMAELYGGATAVPLYRHPPKGPDEYDHLRNAIQTREVALATARTRVTALAECLTTVLGHLRRGEYAQAEAAVFGAFNKTEET